MLGSLGLSKGQSKKEAVKESDIRPNDVLGTPGKMDHPGNLLFHHLISDHKDTYNSSNTTRAQKTKIAQQIFQQMKDLQLRVLRELPRRGQEAERCWYVETDEKWILNEKIKRALRPPKSQRKLCRNIVPCSEEVQGDDEVSASSNSSVSQLMSVEDSLSARRIVEQLCKELESKASSKSLNSDDMLQKMVLDGLDSIDISRDKSHPQSGHFESDPVQGNTGQGLSLVSTGIESTVPIEINGEIGFSSADQRSSPPIHSLVSAQEPSNVSLMTQMEGTRDLLMMAFKEGYSNAVRLPGDSRMLYMDPQSLVDSLQQQDQDFEIEPCFDSELMRAERLRAFQSAYGEGARLGGSSRFMASSAGMHTDAESYDGALNETFQQPLGLADLDQVRHEQLKLFQSSFGEGMRLSRAEKFTSLDSDNSGIGNVVPESAGAQRGIAMKDSSSDRNESTRDNLGDCSSVIMQMSIGTDILSNDPSSKEDTYSLSMMSDAYTKESVEKL